MTIDVKNENGTWNKVEQPFYKVNDRDWVPLKRVMQKIATGEWVEVWPSEIVRETVAGGSGFCINIWDEMGRPTAPGNYTYINNGMLGGGVDCPAIRTGNFPAGSNVKIINNGTISGRGGDGGVVSGAHSFSRYPKPGGDGIWLDCPTTVINNGLIQGGGGGGGACSEQSNTHYYGGGGGGAGYPAGLGGGAGGQNGTLTTGGSSNWGYSWNGGGAPGQYGAEGYRGVGNSPARTTNSGARGGFALQGSDYLLPESVGMNDPTRVKGVIRGGKGPTGVVLEQVGNRQVNYRALDGSRIIGVSRSGGQNNTNWVVTTSYTTFMGGNRPDYTREKVYLVWIFTLTFTVQRDGVNYTDSIAVNAGSFNSGRASTCFLAGSMITMADGSLKPIEDVEIGEFVRTPFGSSRVRGHDRPVLGDRKLYQMDHDGKCKASGEHDLWGRNPATKEEWWTTRDMEEWLYELSIGKGSVYSPNPVDLGELPPGTEWEFATIDNWVTTSWSEIEAPDGPETQLYHLWLDDGGAYFVDGYMAKAMNDTTGMDWHQYEHLKGLPKD